jgi:ribonuclease E
MAKRMLIDATHPEETRVVVLDGNRLDEFDFETSTKKQVKGNIYLAKITRVEPSLQAAFVDFGGNRHGFLAFSEIHPDYYRIPVGDRAPSRDERGGRRDRRRDEWAETENGHREAEIEERRSDDRSHEDQPHDGGPDDDYPHEGHPHEGHPHEDHPHEDHVLEDRRHEDHPREDHPREGHAEEGHAEEDHALENRRHEGDPQEDHRQREPLAGYGATEIAAPPVGSDAGRVSPTVEETPPALPYAPAAQPGLDLPPPTETRVEEAGDRDYASRPERSTAAEVSMLPPETEGGDNAAFAGEPVAAHGEPSGEPPPVVETVETVGGDEFEEAARQRSRSLRHYKIQEVVKRRQIMLVQVTKEERGNKGAALTTYLSLAGRYCVLMPNTGRGGGVSRKITSATDRRRLKELLDELDLPEGMGVIVRTAGSERSKAEIKRDLEYLLRLWDEIRSLTLQSTAPALIYEEGNLIKRSIRDLYARDIDEVLVEGEEGYKTAKAFMKMLMPSHAKRVQPYRDSIPLFHRFQVESQIDLIHSPVVQLRSGGYIVINPTEALVAIDVNSGRSTKERNIEETALRTNLEAAEEIARQLRLRDLAGLIVIDFIDMEEHRNQGAVERRLKEGMKYDRARIQLGRISPFGLLELSRQRLRPSLVEASTQPCPHCAGTGHIRSTESTALHVLRAIEEEGIRRRSAEICIYVPTAVALYVLNQKRQALAQIEMRYGFRVTVAHDDTLIPPAFRLERLRNLTPEEAAMIPAAPMQLPPPIEEDDDEEIEESEEAATTTGAAPEQGEEISEEERGRRRRRRRRRRRPGEEPQADQWTQPHDGSHDPHAQTPDRVEEDGGHGMAAGAPMPAHHYDHPADAAELVAAPGEQLSENAVPGPEPSGDGEHPGGRKRRRRGKRGGRRRGRGDAPGRSPGDDAAGRADDAPHAAAAEQIEVVHEPATAEPHREDTEPAFAVSTFRVAEETVDMAEAPVMDAGETLRDHRPLHSPPEHGAADHMMNDAGRHETVSPRAEPPQSPMPEPSAPVGEPDKAPADAGSGTTVPEPKLVTEKPANPKRGWWQRLIDS